MDMTMEDLEGLTLEELVEHCTVINDVKGDIIAGIKETDVSFEASHAGMITGFNKVQEEGIDGMEYLKAHTIHSLLVDCVGVYDKMSEKYPTIATAPVPLVGRDDLKLGNFVVMVKSMILDLETHLGGL
jgi:hypothetical protein